MSVPIHIGDDNSFLLFFRYVQRYNIPLSEAFDRLLHHQVNSTYDKGKDLFENELTWACFDAFSKYRFMDQSIHFFWYVCVLYFAPLEDLRRFYTWMQISFWRASQGDNLQTLSNEDVIKWDKETLLGHIKAFLDCSTTHLTCFLHALSVFF